MNGYCYLPLHQCDKQTAVAAYLGLLTKSYLNIAAVDLSVAVVAVAAVADHVACNKLSIPADCRGSGKGSISLIAKSVDTAFA